MGARSLGLGLARRGPSARHHIPGSRCRRGDPATGPRTPPPRTAARLAARLQSLLVPGVVINGRVLVGMGPRLPNHLRGVLLSHLHVLARLRGESLEMNEAAELTHYLEVTCSGLLPKLYEEWYGEDGALRPAYAVPGKAPKVPKAKGEKPPPKGGGGKAEGGVQTRAASKGSNKEKASPSSSKKGSPGGGGESPSS